MEILKNTKKIISDEDDEEVTVENKAPNTNENHLSLKEDNNLKQESKVIKPTKIETPSKNPNLSNGNKGNSDLLAKIKNQIKNVNTNINSKPNTNEKEKNKSPNFLNKKKERETKKVVDDESSSSFTEEDETEEEYYDEKKVKESLGNPVKANKDKKSVKVSITNNKNPVNKSSSTPTKKPQNSAIKNKDGLVFEILKRWWYVIEIDWYKIDEDVNEVLKKRGLRQIDLSEWKMQEDVVNGLKKCVELKGFPLVFLDCDEQYHDLRNKQNCPSFNNLVKKVSFIIKSYICFLG